MVPYLLQRHQGQSDEENLYKACLAQKLPNIKPDDYMKCSHNIYGARAEVLMRNFLKTAEDLLDDLHWKVQKKILLCEQLLFSIGAFWEVHKYI